VKCDFAESEIKLFQNINVDRGISTPGRLGSLISVSEHTIRVNIPVFIK
jgi:hypothetical protein